MRPHDFRDRRSFPGLEGGPFELLVTWAERIDRIPDPVFALLLLIPASLLGWAVAWDRALVGVYALGDWILLAALPRRRISFGPPKAPTLLLLFLRLPFALLPFPAHLALQSAGTVLVIYGFWIEPQQLGVTRQRLRSSKLDGRPSLRMVHFGDLHMERSTERDRRLVSIIHSLQPDVILFSGDFLSYSCVQDPEAWAAARQIFAALSAPLGVFAVSGSPPVDPEDVVAQILEGTHVRWLRDERVSLRRGPAPIDLVGLGCTHKPYLDAPRLAALTACPPENFTILLYHSPDLAPHAAECGIDLQLSGHTHGGQVRLPFLGALYPSSLYGKRLEVGRRQLGATTLYVTRGLGLEGKGAPRVRFLSRPEVTLWEIGGSETGPAGSSSQRPSRN